MLSITNILLIIIILNTCECSMITSIILGITLLYILIETIVDIVNNAKEIKKENKSEANTKK